MRHSWILDSIIFFITPCLARLYMALANAARTALVLQGDLCDRVRYRLSLVSYGFADTSPWMANLAI